MRIGGGKLVGVVVAGKFFGLLVLLLERIKVVYR